MPEASLVILVDELKKSWNEVIFSFRSITKFDFSIIIAKHSITFSLDEYYIFQNISFKWFSERFSEIDDINFIIS